MRTLRGHKRRKTNRGVGNYDRHSSRVYNEPQSKEEPMRFPSRAFWIAGSVGAAVSVVSVAVMALFALEFPSTGIARAGGPRWIPSVPLVPLILLTLVGAVSAFLAWRLGAQRWERLSAGICPAVVVLCLALYSFLHLRGALHLSLVLVFAGAIKTAWGSALYLVVGTLPFLIPHERRGPSASP